MTDYHPVTKEELEQIELPKGYEVIKAETSNGGTNFDIFHDGDHIAITFTREMGNYIVRCVDNGYTRGCPDPLALLEAWFIKNNCNGCPYGGNLIRLIKQLRTNPDAVLKELKEKGVWKE